MSSELTPEHKALAQEVGLDIQPDPVHNDNPSTHDQAVNDLKFAANFMAGGTGASTPDVYMALLKLLIFIKGKDGAIEMMKKRKEFGLRKYGTILQAGNGRDVDADTADELADAIAYWRIKVTEEGGWTGDGYGK